MRKVEKTELHALRAPPDMRGLHRQFQRLAENAGVAHNALDVFLGDPEKYSDVPDVTDDPADSTAEPADAP